jgi:hypothetical protein
LFFFEICNWIIKSPKQNPNSQKMKNPKPRYLWSGNY